MSQTASKSDQDVFTKKLADYKKAIEADISAYSRQLQTSTLQQFGKNARLDVDIFLDILGRGGKRIRGALVMLGYEMSGGTNKKMILEAARAVEMLHAYVLILDDIQDRSVLRRGAPTAHLMLADHHEKHELAGSAGHFGVSIALNAAMTGAHAAQAILSNLDIEPELGLKVISIVNRTMVITAHGQTADIMNEMVAEVSRADIERVLESKTALYTFLNPLHVGMVLAGADCDATDAITDYAIHAGKTFQITDDILGVFGSELESGKSPMDDMREGKRTLLIFHALEKAGNADKNFLIQMLGNENITPVEFHRCKDILVQSGAVEAVKAEAKEHVGQALHSLDKEAFRWSHEGVQFLRGLAEYMLTRNS